MYGAVDRYLCLLRSCFKHNLIIVSAFALEVVISIGFMLNWPELIMPAIVS